MITGTGKRFLIASKLGYIVQYHKKVLALECQTSLSASHSHLVFIGSSVFEDYQHWHKVSNDNKIGPDRTSHLELLALEPRCFPPTFTIGINILRASSYSKLYPSEVHVAPHKTYQQPLSTLSCLYVPKLS